MHEARGLVSSMGCAFVSVSVPEFVGLLVWRSSAFPSNVWCLFPYEVRTGEKGDYMDMDKT